MAGRGLIPAAAGRERLLPGDLDAAARGAGLGSLADAAAVILETDGTLTVVTR